MIILYHANCNDGSASALAAWMKLGDAGHRYIAVSHGQPPPDVTGEDVLLVDFCYPRDTLIGLDARSVTIIDHHVSAQKALATPFAEKHRITAHFDMSKSGAVLTWEHFFPHEPLPQLFAYIQDRDIWTRLWPESAWLSYGLTLFSSDFRQWRTLVEDKQQLAETIRSGKNVFDYVNQQALNIISTRETGSIAGFDVPVVNAPGFMVSDLLNDILKIDPDAPFAAAYYDQPDVGLRYYSLRSDDSREDVSLIAACYGGGGHRNAAGFSLPLTLARL